MANNLALRCNSRIVLFHASYFTDLKKSAELPYADAIKTSLQQSQRLLQEKIKKFTSRVKGNKNRILFEAHTHFGPSPEKEIINAAKRKKCILIIISKSDKKGIGKLIRGSVTSLLIQQSGIPLLIVPAFYRFKAPQKVIYFTDLQRTKHELAIVKHFAVQFQMKIEIVFIDFGWSETFKEMKNLSLAFRSEFPFHHLRKRIETPVEDHIAAYVKHHPGSIACLFHHKKNWLASLFEKNISNRVANQLHAPLLVFTENYKG